MRYVLVIPGWFPSKVNFLAGDFIERHAKAASLFFPVKVLFVVKDNSLPFGKTMIEHQHVSEHYECLIYYYSSGSSIPLFEKMVSVSMQAKCLAAGFKKIIRQHGLPSLIHVHVLVKHAWFALRQSKKHNIPLLASEQWTGYLPGAEAEFNRLSFFQRRVIRQTFARAVHVTTVSGYLARKIRDIYSFRDYTVIPNLVDTSIFIPSNQKNNITTFIHISTLSYQKNFDEILEACVMLNKKAVQYRLIVVSPYNAYYQQKVSSLGLNEQVEFKSEVPQAQLSQLVAVSDALILYSNYETFGCVIVEANACGVPVITSDCPVFEENVEEGVTGFRVALHDPVSLADRMLKIVNKQHLFSKQQIISITKEKYAAEVVGQQFAALYERYAKP